jgi:hypothetical protein
MRRIVAGRGYGTLVRRITDATTSRRHVVTTQPAAPTLTTRSPREPPMTTRRLLIAGMPLWALPALRARAADTTLVDEKDPTASSLGYVDDAHHADRARFAQFAPGQACANCALFQGAAGAPSGPCPLYVGKLVKANGWCSAYVMKKKA